MAHCTSCLRLQLSVLLQKQTGRGAQRLGTWPVPMEEWQSVLTMSARMSIDILSCSSLEPSTGCISLRRLGNRKPCTACLYHYESKRRRLLHAKFLLQPDCRRKSNKSSLSIRVSCRCKGNVSLQYHRSWPFRRVVSEARPQSNSASLHAAASGTRQESQPHLLTRYSQYWRHWREVSGKEKVIALHSP